MWHIRCNNKHCLHYIYIISSVKIGVNDNTWGEHRDAPLRSLLAKDWLTPAAESGIKSFASSRIVLSGRDPRSHIFLEQLTSND